MLTGWGGGRGAKRPRNPVHSAYRPGTVQGGSQALSRSVFARMIPKHKSSEFFGFFSVFEKFAGIAGPAMFAASVTLFGSSRMAGALG